MILFEDRDIIVCHKKAGIPVQSARIGQKDMVSILNNHLAEKSDHYKQSEQGIFVVHRLDQPVEGVIVFAKTKKAAAVLSKQITDGSMKKRYQAVVCVTETGKKWITELEGTDDSLEKASPCFTLVDYLAKNGKTNCSAVVSEKQKDAKKAELDFQIIKTSREYALVSVHLKTGRHHQIRVQMSHAGLPLYGDQKYHENWQDYVKKEENPENELFGYFGSAPAKGHPQLALCSVELQFLHPSAGKKMIFKTQPTTEAFQIFE